jgi:GH18 family chitinase
MKLTFNTFKKALIFSLFAGLFLGLQAAPRVVGFYPYWAQYSQFKAENLKTDYYTHIHYGYFKPVAGGTIEMADLADTENLKALSTLCKNKGIKLVLTIGGSGMSDDFAPIASDNVSRAAFISNVQKLIEEWGAAGVELSWSGVTADQKDSYAQILKDLSSALKADAAKPILAVTVPWNPESATGYDAEALKLVDYVSIQNLEMMDESNEVVIPHSSLPTTQAAIDYWAGLGLAKDKILLNAPLFGKSYMGADKLGAPHQGVGSGNEGYLTWKELMAKFDGADYKVEFDAATSSEFAIGNGEIIVFNGIPSLKALAEVIKNQGLGGVVVNDVASDDEHAIISLQVTLMQVLKPEMEFKKK